MDPKEGFDCIGYAAHDAKAVLVPFKFKRRTSGPDDVVFRVTHCGICYAEVVWTRNFLGDVKYPVVPGHEIVGVVTKVVPVSGSSKLEIVWEWDIVPYRGHMAVTFGKAFDPANGEIFKATQPVSYICISHPVTSCYNSVTVFSTSPSKEEALGVLGADAFVVSKD